MKSIVLHIFIQRKHQHQNHKKFQTFNFTIMCQQSTSLYTDFQYKTIMSFQYQNAYKL